MAQIRADSYDRAVREQNLLQAMKRQEKQQILDLNLINSSAGNDDEYDDFFEKMKMRKVNQKFSKLMNFNLEESDIVSG